MVKTSGGVGSLLDWGAKTPHALQPKDQNINNGRSIVTCSIKTLKMVPIKKKKEEEVKVMGERQKVKLCGKGQDGNVGSQCAQGLPILEMAQHPKELNPSMTSDLQHVADYRDPWDSVILLGRKKWLPTDLHPGSHTPALCFHFKAPESGSPY